MPVSFFQCLLLWSTFSLIPWHCSSIHVSFAFLWPFYKLACWILYKVLHLQSYSSFFSSLRLSHSFSMLSVTQGFFAGRCLLLAVGCFCHGSVKAVIKASISMSWFSRARSGANFPRISSAMLGFLSFSRLSLILMVPWFFTLWRRSLKVNITSLWSLPISAPRKLLVFAMFTLNSFFRAKSQHKVSWRQPCSKQWHQLDLILVRCAAIKNVLHTRSYHSADFNTDRFLVCCKIRMQPKKSHSTNTKGNPRIDVSETSQPDLMEQFAQTFEKEFGTSQPGDSATEKWEALCDTVPHCFGYLWEEVFKITWLFRSQINCHDKPSEQSTNALRVRGTYRFLELPGARLSRLLGVEQTNTGQDSARTSSLPP